MVSGMSEPKTGYDALMDEVCVGMGFCGNIVDGSHLHVDMFIPNEGTVSADQFIHWLFRAEGVKPCDEPEQWAKYGEALKAGFIRHMGAEAVAAEALRRVLS